MEDQIFSTEFANLFFRIIGSLSLIPIKFNFSGLISRSIIALCFASFLYQISPTPINIGQVGIFLNFLIGFCISFSLLFTFWSWLVVFEITEISRGMNYATFFTSEEIDFNQNITLGIKLLFFVLFVNAGFLEELLTQISSSLINLVSYQDLITNLATNSLNSVGTGFVLAIPIIGSFLVIQILLMLINKLYPQSSFFTEMFMAKAFILLLVIRGLL